MEELFFALVYIMFSPFIIIIIAVLLAMFALFLDAVTFAVSSFLHDIISSRRSKED